ncbi:unnamed protein product [Closterium sp. NIES-53]
MGSRRSTGSYSAVLSLGRDGEHGSKGAMAACFPSRGRGPSFLILFLSHSFLLSSGQAWAAGELVAPTVRSFRKGVVESMAAEALWLLLRWFRKGVVESMAAEALWRPADVIAAAAADAAIGAADPDAAAKAAESILLT